MLRLPGIKCLWKLDWKAYKESFQVYVTIYLLRQIFFHNCYSIFNNINCEKSRPGISRCVIFGCLSAVGTFCFRVPTEHIKGISTFSVNNPSKLNKRTRCRRYNDVDSYLGYPRFEFRLGYQLFCLGFSWFCLVPQGKLGYSYFTYHISYDH